MDHSEELAAALNGHQVTNEEGQVAEETAQETSAPQDQTPDTIDATAEKSAETPDSTPVEAKATENEPEMVETASDETGKRYVPEERFKKVYAKWKDAERRAKAQGETPPPMPIQAKSTKPVEKTDALEMELLRTTLPQFNPDHPEYSREIDELGYSLYEGSKDSKGHYTITRLDAARKALGMAKRLNNKVADAKIEARTVKAQQSDQGITNRVLNREGTKTDPMSLSLDEKEKWLKENGMWD